MSNRVADQFEVLGNKLTKNIYGTDKGDIRLALLKRDVQEYCHGFASDRLNVIDIGGGGGQFAAVCLSSGHTVEYIDKSPEMVAQAKQTLKGYSDSIRIFTADFLTLFTTDREYDLVLMHGSAEWMADPKEAIRKASMLVTRGGIMSLAVYNRDRHIFKRGVSGQLLVGEVSTKKQRLTPPGALGALELRNYVDRLPGGEVVMQSGIRVFHSFFRSVPSELLSFDEWLTQEIRYYRREPFSALGEHTHLIWRRK